MADNEENQDPGERFPARVVTDLALLPSLQSMNNVALNITDANREAMLSVIRTHCPDPSVIEDDGKNVYVWAAEISNSRRDYYWTRMDPLTTLRNYVADAIEGTSFMNSHNIWEFPLARSFAAAGVADGELECVYAAFYTIADLELSSVKTNDLIRGIRAGVLKDVSVGFKRGDHFMARCSICGLDMWRDWNCEHFQGCVAKVWDEDEGVFREVMALAVLVDAHLAEVSGVYNGAAPRSIINKAIDFAQRGILPETFIHTLEGNYRIHLPGKTVQIPGKKKSDDDDETRILDSDESNFNEEGENMNGEGGDNKPKIHTAVTRAVEKFNLVKENESVTSTEDAMLRLTTEMSRLRSIETAHNAFLDAEKTDALKEGVRAVGAEFDEDRFKRMFDSMTLTDIRLMKLDWSKKAEELELEGGRRSVEEGEDDDEGDDDESTDGQPPSQRKVPKDKKNDNRVLQEPTSLFR